MRLFSGLLLAFFFIPMAVVLRPWDAMDYAATFLLVTILWSMQKDGN
jgi:hypothetical protein